MSALPDGVTTGVTIREVGPRDGLQIEQPISTEAKTELLEALVATGVTEIEATAFVSPRAVPAMADAEAVAALLERWPEVRFSALVAGLGGVRRAIAAGVTDLEYVVSAGDSHSHANVGRGTEESLALVPEVAELVHAAGGRLEVIVATAWDCPFDGPTPPARSLDIATRAAETGADALSIADTIGTTTPGRTIRLMSAVAEAIPDVPLGIHLHDTRGTGIASAWAAHSVGVRRFDASVGGLGGCPFAPGASGNIATEELVYLFEDGGIDTGLDLEACLSATAVAERLLAKPMSSSLYRAGGAPRPVAR